MRLLKTIKRRTFIDDSARWVAAIAFGMGNRAIAMDHRVSASSHKDSWLLGGLTLNAETGAGEIIDSRKSQLYFLGVLPPSDQQPKRISVPFPPHSVLKHPSKPWTVIAIPNASRGSNVMEIDLKAEKVTQEITAVNQKGFYGHGLFSADGQLLLVEFGDENSTIVTIRDPSNYREIGRFKTFGLNPHELGFLDQRRVLVCNHDTASIIDSNSGELLQKFKVEDENQVIAHMQVIPKADPIVMCSIIALPENKGKEGKMFRLDLKKGKMVEMKYPRPLVGQALSSALSSGGVIGVTHQEADYLSFWDARTYECQGVIPFENHPRGVVLSDDGKDFLFSSIEGKLFAVKGNKWSEFMQVELASSFSNNPHLCRLRFG